MTFSTKCRTAACVAAIAALATPAVPLAGAQDMRMPDTRDVAQGRDLTPASVAAPSAPSVPNYGGLDWASAALGAAAATLLRRARTRVVA